MCTFQARNEELLLYHISKIHRDDLNFLVSCSKCLRSFRLWDSYKKHRYRGCKTTIEPNGSVSMNQSDEIGSLQDFDELPDQLPDQPDEPQQENGLGTQSKLLIVYSSYVYMQLFGHHVRMYQLNLRLGLP